MGCALARTAKRGNLLNGIALRAYGELHQCSNRKASGTSLTNGLEGTSGGSVLTARAHPAYSIRHIAATLESFLHEQRGAEHSDFP